MAGSGLVILSFQIEIYFLNLNSDPYFVKFSIIFFNYYIKQLFPKIDRE